MNAKTATEYDERSFIRSFIWISMKKKISINTFYDRFKP